MVVASNWFIEWFNSPYFYQLYYQKTELEAAAFLEKIMTYLGTPAGSFMLDVGCGKGRYSKMLASYGQDVTGIDISFYGIEEAKKSESDHLHFFQHDVRLPFWINYFNYAVNLFTSFGYFKSEREHYNVIRTISNSIKPNGTFVMDYLNTHYDEDHLVHKADKEIGGVNFHMTKWFDETHFYKKIVVEDENLKEPLEYQEKVAKFSLGDFNDMFAFHHLQMQEVFGDYQFNKYNIKDSPRLIMIAKKVQK